MEEVFADLARRMEEGRRAKRIPEAEWLSASDPGRLFQHLFHIDATPSERKYRLFACACCRRLWPHLGSLARAVVEACEAVMDGEAAVFDPFRVWSLESNLLSEVGEGPAADAARHVVWGFELSCSPRSPQEGAAEGTARYAVEAAEQAEAGSGMAERVVQAGLLRDLLGNPFRPSVLDPGLRTEAVLSLAQAAYEGRLLPSGVLAPDHLGVLSDALEEAGCADETLLAHMRSPGPHVRGCWALDLILGKAWSASPRG
jgi:hypothetical protein